MAYTRAHIRLNTAKDATMFVAQLNSLGNTDKYIVEDNNGVQRANARSLVGMIYAMSDYNDEMYLVNETNNGDFPSFIDEYRV